MKNKQINQFSTLNSLVLGNYKGELKVHEALSLGNFGIGTYDGLDGEAIIIDGKAYNGRANGIVEEPSKEETLPFCMVASFNSFSTKRKIHFDSYSSFEKIIEPFLDSNNYFYAIKLHGVFNVRYRSFYKQEDDVDKKLIDLGADEKQFEHHEIVGDVIGFYSPNFAGGITLPGWHLHFISSDRKLGGHILKFSTFGDVEFQIEKYYGLNLILPSNEKYKKVDLNQNISKEILKVEAVR